MADDFDDVVQLIPIQTTARGHDDGVPLAAIELVSQTRSAPGHFVPGSHRSELQEMRAHRQRSPLVAGERQRDESFGGDQAFALNPRVRKQPGDMGGWRRRVGVGPAADHLKMRPQDGVAFAGGRGARVRCAARPTRRAISRAQIARERIAPLRQAIHQQRQERRIPHRDEPQAAAADERQQRQIPEGLHVLDVPHRGRHRHDCPDEPLLPSSDVSGVVLESDRNAAAGTGPVTPRLD